MTKRWMWYSYFMIGLFSLAAIANIFNAQFFWGHGVNVIQKIAWNFAGLVGVDLSLIVLHIIFLVQQKTPSRWWQMLLTAMNVFVAILNITLLIR